MKNSIRARDTILIYDRANEHDSSVLSQITKASKKYWGYSDELMDLWKEDLGISRDYINENEVTKVLLNGKLIGFYALKFNETMECYEIDHFWLLPEFIGQGFGKRVFRHIMETLAKKNQTKVTLSSDPNAAGFYEKMHGKIIGQKESKVSGCYLPIFEFTVK